MDIFKRRMFENGGSVGPQQIPSKILSREVRELGYRNPYQEITQIEQQGDLLYERIYDQNGRLKRERIIERGLSPTGDLQEALSRQKINELVKSTVETAPLLVGGGLAGLGLKVAAGSKLGKNILQGAGKTGSGIINFLTPFKMNPKFVKNPNLGKAIKGKTDKDGNPIIDTQKKVLQDRGVTESFDKNYLGIPKSLNEIRIKPLTSAAYGVAGSTAAVDPIVDALTTTPEEVQEQFEQKVLESDMSQLEKMTAIESARAQKNPIKDAQSIADFDADLTAILEEETPALTPTAAPEEVVEDEPEEQVQEEPQGQQRAQVTANSLSNFFSSDAFNSALRNIGSSLVREGRFGAGLAAGSAGFAEEQEAKRLLEQERLAKLMASGGLDFKDKLSLNKEVRDTELKLAGNVRDFNNAQAAYELAQSVIDLANGNQNLATFGSKIGATVDNLLAGFGYKTLDEFEELDDTEKARIALNELTNRNIKEILGESGRTISNIDRDIAKRVVGTLDLTDIKSVGSLKKTLQNNIQMIVEEGNAAQREIASNSKFLLQYVPSLFKDDPELLEILQKDFGAPTGTISTQDIGNLKPRVVKTTLRG